jgi:hypothetical protein
MTRMPFGKYKGRLLEDVPTSYLEWLADLPDLSARLHYAVEDELQDRRDGAGDERDQQTAVVAWEPLVKAWYGQLCRKWHPDRGGSIDGMKAVNDAHERLREMLTAG